MKVAARKFVSIDYRLTLDSGEEVDRTAEGKPLGFIVGAGMIIPGLEHALEGMAAGDKALVTVEPEDGYGHVDRDLFQEVPRAKFPEGLELVPGAMFLAQGPRGPVNITVAEVGESSVTVDLNHPLAGKRLTFDVSVVGVREPAAAELSALEGKGGCECGSTCGSGGGEPSCGPEACGPGCGCR